MSSHQVQRSWREIAEEVAHEEDDVKLAKLIDELAEALDNEHKLEQFVRAERQTHPVQRHPL